MTARWFGSRNTSVRRAQSNQPSTIPQAKTYGRLGVSRMKDIAKLITSADGLVHLSTSVGEETAITKCGLTLPNHGAGRKTKSPTCIGCLAL